MPIQEASSTFVSFPDKDEILDKLRSMEGYGKELEPLSRLVADRLALKAYDSSAFVFILIELIYEFQEIYGGPLSDLLTRAVKILTRDEELAASALDAYNEIKATLEPPPENGSDPSEPEGQEASPASEDAAAAEKRDETVTTDHGVDMTPSLDDTRPGEIDDQFLADAFPIGDRASLDSYVSRPKRPDQERLMVALQEAQKRLADLGFSTRMAIDMTLGASDRDNVSHTLREIASLRAALRDFDALLADSLEQILEEIGVLDQD